MAAIKFTKVKHVTLPLIKLENNKELYLKFVGAIYVGKAVDDKKEPPHLAHVIDMETGEEGLIITGAVLFKELTEGYPDDSYINRIFCITKTAPEGTRKYSLYSITEVQVQAEEAVSAETPAKKK